MKKCTRILTQELPWIFLNLFFSQKKYCFMIKVSFGEKN